MDDIKDATLPVIEDVKAPNRVEAVASPLQLFFRDFLAAFVAILTAWSILYIIFNAIGSGLADGWYSA